MEKQSSYKDIVDGIGEALFIHYPDSGLVYDVNETMLNMYGYSRDEVVGKSIEHLSSVEDGFIIQKANVRIQNALNGKVELFEWKAKRKDNSTFWVEVSLKLAKLNNREWLIAVVRDITEKKRNEEIIRRFTDFQFLLSELSTKFLSIPNSKLDYEIDFTLRVLGNRFKADRAYVFTYEYDLQLMSNTHEWCNLNVKSYKDELQKLVVSKFKWQQECLHRDGYLVIPDVDKIDDNNKLEKEEFKREGIQSLLIVPFYANGKITGFIGLDAVKKKRNWTNAELEELRAIGNVIGQSLIRRNYEIQLKIAKEKAEESDRLKSAFLSNMSHEIRTPMNGILGFAQLLEQDDIENQERKNFTKIIIDSSKQLLSIINDIIDISKIESGQINLNLEKIDINDIIQEILEFFKPIATTKGIKIKSDIKIPKNMSELTTDGVKLKQILTNLINNAIKFTPVGFVSLQAFVESENLICKIIDSGVGMDEETLRIIFNRFTRANDEFSVHVSGTGLGLSISKAYAEELGGNIFVESEKGKGSVFTFKIPLGLNE